MALTSAQQRRFWQAFRPAWHAHAGRSSLDPSDRAAAEAWRHAVTAEECNGATSLKQLGNEEFDAIMLRLSQEAGDMAGVAYWSASAERRMRHLLSQKLAELDQLDPMRQHAPAYLAGLFRQAKHPAPFSSLDDIPAEHLFTALQMLDTHVRRLRRHARPVVSILEAVPF